ncbi:ATP-binding protein [Jannaschia sp.]|nr:ATP-binding protein [Jannaschia sp.]
MTGLKRTLALALCVAIATAAVWFASYRYFVAEEIEQAEGRLSLYRSTVLAEVERFEHLTQVLVVDPFVLRAVETGETEELNPRLARFAEAGGLEAIYLMDADGTTIAASNVNSANSFVGHNYSFRPYFSGAREGGTGRFYGIGTISGQPGYFIADPVRSVADGIVGVVALKISLVPFEESWRSAGEQVLLTDRHDVVLLASDPAWRYRTLNPLTPPEREAIAAVRQFPGQALAPLDWTVDGGRARLNGDTRLMVQSRALPNGWTLHYLASDGRAVTRAWLAAGAVLVLSALLLIGAQFQRARRLGGALRRSEREEAALRLANTRLACEIDDRRSAERKLQETREELDRAGKLAALGRLAASVTHELGQPIAAMRNHLAAHEMTGGDGALTGKIGGLVDRMEGITRQLKFFARSDGDNFEDVDLRDAVAAVLDLMAPGLDGVTLHYDPPDWPLIARGSRLRLEQVLTNLMRNALDAMEEGPCQMTVRLGAEDGSVWVEVADTGHGLGDATLAELREPFVTTRESGQGMGLGLAISSGILDDHGGRLEARNRAGGGAAFRMVLPAPAPREMAAE